MEIDASVVSLVSAATALVASIAGPAVTLTVARRQISANIVSVNRHRWIESLRDLIAEMIALLATGTLVRLERAREAGSINALIASDPAVIEKIERIVLVRNKIRLMTNPNEDDHRELLDTIEVAFRRLAGDQPMGDPQEVTRSIDESIQAITRCAQGILKREWSRVKRGE
jgi:hypothetical protein